MVQQLQTAHVQVRAKLINKISGEKGLKIDYTLNKLLEEGTAALVDLGRSFPYVSNIPII